MKDLKTEISKAVKEKKLVVGTNKTIKALQTKEVGLVAVSSRAPVMLVNRLNYYCALTGVQLTVVNSTTLEIGSMCGKPHTVAAFSVLS